MPSPRIDPEVQEISSATPTSGARGATASDQESKDSRLEEELLLLFEKALQDPASKRVESPRPPIDPAVQQDLAVSSATVAQVFICCQHFDSFSLFILLYFLFASIRNWIGGEQVANPSASSKAAATNGPGGMMAIYSRHWGPERSVQILRDPTKSLGISIVGGKVMDDRFKWESRRRFIRGES